MGAICVSEEQRRQVNQRKLKAEKKRKEERQALQNCVFAQKVRKYTQLYGCSVTDQTKQFINNNYNFNYMSQTRPLNYPRYGTLSVTYRSSLIDRFQTAHKNGNRTYNLELVKVNDNCLSYKWQIQTKSGKIYYECEAYFDKQDKFEKAYFNQYQPYIPGPIYSYSPSPVIKSSVPQNSTNNNYYQKTDWNAYYNAQVQRSNEQFRQNMNRQAQEWNNYARQKNNRGW